MRYDTIKVKGKEMVVVLWVTAGKIILHALSTQFRLMVVDICVNNESAFLVWLEFKGGEYWP
jgi:hypothetical protein